MASFLYFVPGVDQQALVRDGRLNHVELKRWKLHETLADVHEVPNQCIATKIAAGPGGQPGLVLTPHPANPVGGIPRVPGYHAESQTWWKADKSDDNPWIGFETQSPPTPEDLERRNSISGYRRCDDFGRSWLIPVLRGRESQYGFLPVDYDWSSRSFTAGVTLRGEFEQLWVQSARIWDHLYVEGFNVSESFLSEFVGRCLAVNYRVGPDEFQAFLRLKTPVFDRTSLNPIAALACDYPAVMEFAAKKKITIAQAALDGTCSSHGDPAGTVDLDQAAASSE